MAVAEREAAPGATGENPSKIWPAEKTHERYVTPRNWEESEEWKAGDDIADIVQKLIAAHPDRFGHLTPLTIACLWKKNGRTQRGQKLYGKASVPGGITRHFLDGAQFMIWLAADHLMDDLWTHLSVEAFVFSLLCGMDEDDEGKLTIAAPDFSGFVAELEEYGAWRDQLRDGAKAFHQVSLFGES